MKFKEEIPCPTCNGRKFIFIGRQEKHKFSIAPRRWQERSNPVVEACPECCQKGGAKSSESPSET
ncbi:MAG: hypothetical protein A2122_01620 [Candidatus Liptonbacteria bacterium GWB1_49_6]|uniref:Uncharacterized protein n=1 Tax=Candidatus Liptonbacteria bacterium GWB1_49_6 TaxID=1798644 RepID=A0A1G2C4R2_9BACT|nr:MAG: hypothetical protein A2122_01620 [Candidatus Liptonbacteria bacterium GWB1_49_6]